MEEELQVKMIDLLEHLQCPICFEVPDGRVFQCKNGHTFCNQCSTQLKICPQCRAFLGSERIRNRTLEELLDLAEFKCPNKGLGCEKVLRRQEISGHLKYCKFEPFYFCKLIGFQDCPYNAINCLKSQESSEVLKHLREAHPNLTESDIGKENILHLTYDNLISTTRSSHLQKGSVSVWTPHLARYHPASAKGEEVVLLFLCQISEMTRNAAWICLSMTDCCPTVVEYKISCRDKDKDDLLAPEIKWKAPVMPFKDIEKELENFALRIPLCVLNTLREGKGADLSMEVKLVQQDQFHNQLDERRMGLCVNVKELTTFIATISSQQAQRLANSQSVTEREEEGDGEGHVFENVFCNECGQRPVTNIRYKCLQCIDFDLCRRCMDSGEVHMHHVFARIQNQQQNDYFNWKHRLRLKKGKSSYI